MTIGTFWDKVAYSCLWVVAILEAADGGIKLAPDLAAKMPESGLLFNIFPFIPLALLMISGMIIVIRHFGKTTTRVVPVGIEFFASKTELELHQRNDIDSLLAQASKIDAINVSARTLNERHLQNKDRIRRMILINPASQSLSQYAKSVGAARNIPVDIAETTRSFKERGAQVRWYPDPIGHSVLIGDGESQSGWVQVEALPPFIPLNLRPSWRAYRKEQERLVRAFVEIFEKMWSESKDPTAEDIALHLGGSLTSDSVREIFPPQKTTRDSIPNLETARLPHEAAGHRPLLRMDAA